MLCVSMDSWSFRVDAADATKIISIIISIIIIITIIINIFFIIIIIFFGARKHEACRVKIDVGLWSFVSEVTHM